MTASMDLGTVLSTLEASRARNWRVFDELPAELWSVRPGEDEWSAGEVAQHFFIAESMMLRDIGRAVQETIPKPDYRRLAGQEETRGGPFGMPGPLQGRDPSEIQSMQAEVRSLFFDALTEMDARGVLAESVLHHPMFGELQGAAWVSFYCFHDWMHGLQGERAASAARENGSSSGVTD